MVTKKSHRFTAALVFALTLLSVGCAKQPTKSKEPPREYVLRGEVKSLDAKNQLAKIDHEKIEGWMEAMTMEYPIKNPDDFSRLKVGEKIQAKVIVQDLDYWLAEVKEAPPSSTPSAESSKSDLKK